MTMTIANTRAQLADARARLGGTVALVPTMGALHDGHIANIRAAKQAADNVIVSIFVNPLQFAPGEDFDAYPRPLSADLAVCRDEGVDVVFNPDVDVMYPQEPTVTIEPGPLGAAFEGASRPGFFRGVLTVVSKLFHLTRPDVACFGEKDFQQLALVRKMVSDLDFGIEIIGVEILREPDGLARSSRNIYLSGAERNAALAISRALRAAGDSPYPANAARAVLEAADGVELDYLELAGLDLGPAPERGPGRMLVAAKVGTTRLIDNANVHIGAK